MPTELERIVQLACSTFRRNHPDCRRAICRRYGYCVPPRDQDHEHFYRCPFDAEDAWLKRAEIVGKIAQRLIKVGETSRAARGRPSPFAPKPVPDHLDLTKPLDVREFLPPRQDDGTVS